MNERKTIPEQLDDARDGEEFGNVLKGFFAALATAKYEADDE